MASYSMVVTMESPRTSYTVKEFALLTGTAASTVYNNVREHPERLSVNPVRVGTRVSFPAALVHEALGITASQAQRIISGEKSATPEDPTELPALTPEESRIADIIRERKYQADPGRWITMGTTKFAGLPQPEHAPIPVSREEIQAYREQESRDTHWRWGQQKDL